MNMHVRSNLTVITPFARVWNCRWWRWGRWIFSRKWRPPKLSTTAGDLRKFPFSSSYKQAIINVSLYNDWIFTTYPKGQPDNWQYLMITFIWFYMREAWNLANLSMIVVMKFCILRSQLKGMRFMHPKILGLTTKIFLYYACRYFSFQIFGGDSL